MSFEVAGVYNPDSMYRVRVLVREGEPLADSRDVHAVLRERLRTARDARRAIGIPNAETDTYRCEHTAIATEFMVSPDLRQPEHDLLLVRFVTKSAFGSAPTLPFAPSTRRCIRAFDYQTISSRVMAMLG